MQKYNFKDAIMLVKNIEKTCKELSSSKNAMIVKQLEGLNPHQYRSEFGLFSLRANSAKTAKVYTAKEQKQVDELQAKIDELQAQIDKLGKTIVVADGYNSLVYNKTTTADEEVAGLLAPVIESIGNATIAKAASKMIRK